MERIILSDCVSKSNNFALHNFVIILFAKSKSMIVIMIYMISMIVIMIGKLFNISNTSY